MLFSYTKDIWTKLRSFCMTHKIHSNLLFHEILPESGQRVD